MSIGYSCLLLDVPWVDFPGALLFRPFSGVMFMLLSPERLQDPPLLPQLFQG